MKIKLILLFCSAIIGVNSAFSNAYSENDFKSDWAAPFAYKKTRNILAWGTGATILLVANGENFVNPLQEDIAEEEPLGDLASIGDYSGRGIPNIIYAASMYYQGDSKSKRRSLTMVKASVFSGLSVFFLKRMINQQRPDKGDRNSYPSGHTSTAFAFASVISLEHESWSIPAYTLATLVGFSRMNDNVHYLHDVVMGAAIGMAYGYAFHKKAQKNESNLTALPYNDGGMVVFQKRF